MESKIEKRLRLGVEALGGVCLKFNSDSADALPDRIVMVMNEITPITELVELKDDDDPRPKQAIRIAKFQQMGYRVAVLRNSADVDMYLENLKNKIG